MRITRKTARQRMTCLVCYKPIRTRHHYSFFEMCRRYQTNHVVAVAHHDQENKCQYVLTEFFYPDSPRSKVEKYFWS